MWYDMTRAGSGSERQGHQENWAALVTKQLFLNVFKLFRNGLILAEMLGFYWLFRNIKKLNKKPLKKSTFQLKSNFSEMF